MAEQLLRTASMFMGMMWLMNILKGVLPSSYTVVCVRVYG